MMMKAMMMDNDEDCNDDDDHVDDDNKNSDHRKGTFDIERPYFQTYFMLYSKFEYNLLALVQGSQI